MDEITKCFSYLRQLVPSNEFFTPDKGYSGPQGIVHLSGGSWVALRIDNSKLHGQIPIHYLDRNAKKICGRVRVNFPETWGARQMAEIEREIKKQNSKFHGYLVENFVINVPLRVSHTSSCLITLEKDLPEFTVAVEPLVHHKKSQSGIGLLSMNSTQRGGGVGITLSHYYQGRGTSTSLISKSGSFELLGFTHNKAEEAFECLISILDTASIKSKGAIVLPKLNNTNRHMVYQEVTAICRDVAEIRKEPFRISKPIIETHVPDIWLPDEPEEEIYIV